MIRFSACLTSLTMLLLLWHECGEDVGVKHDRQEKPFERYHATSGENPGSNEQGITGKKESDKKTSFNENDRANESSAARPD